MKKVVLGIFLVSLISLFGCMQTLPITNDNSQLPNPASVFCEEQGGTLEIRTASDGSQSGYCIFSDGSECEEWAFFRRECQR